MKLQEYKKGWLVGDFDPALFKSKEVEIGLKEYTKGIREEKHYHKIATEYTIVITGKVRMLNQIFVPGDIVKIEPNIENEFECLEDAKVLVIKTPSVPNDKYC